MHAGVKLGGCESTEGCGDGEIIGDNDNDDDDDDDDEDANVEEDGKVGCSDGKGGKDEDDGARASIDSDKVGASDTALDEETLFSSSGRVSQGSLELSDTGAEGATTEIDGEAPSGSLERGAVRKHEEFRRGLRRE